MIDVLIVGCGQRGSIYASYCAEHPDVARVVGVCDPIASRRKHVKALSQATSAGEWDDWTKITEKCADCVVIATPDARHEAPVIAFARLGYHILVEKPLAPSLVACQAMVAAVEAAGVMLSVGHVMRYSPFTQAVKRAVGKIGKIVSVQHLEPVGYFHFAHSYVRGNWRNEAESSFALLAKSCHDIDWLRYVVGSPCRRVSSFGSLQHFKASEQPVAAKGATRCNACPLKREGCAYSASRIYQDRADNGVTGWPVNVACSGFRDIEEALEKGPYGRCVYHCDNDVVDQQVVSLEFESGATASFTMIAFSKEVCVRKTRIFGTEGELECIDAQFIRLTRHGEPTIDIPFDGAPQGTALTGHHGADYHLAHAFYTAVHTNNPDLILSGPQDTLESHTVVFVAERARHEGAVLTIDSVGAQ